MFPFPKLIQNSHKPIQKPFNPALMSETTNLDGTNLMNGGDDGTFLGISFTAHSTNNEDACSLTVQHNGITVLPSHPTMISQTRDTLAKTRDSLCLLPPSLQT
jgi:hypothetical protein